MQEYESALSILEKCCSPNLSTIFSFFTMHILDTTSQLHADFTNFVPDFRKAHDLAEEKAQKFKKEQAAKAAASGETKDTGGKCDEGKCDKSDQKKCDESAKDCKKKK